MIARCAQAAGGQTPAPLAHDNTALLAMARRHRVAAPIFLAIGARALSSEKSLAAMRNAQISVVVARALTAAGIRTIVLKGAVLAQRLYGDVTARDSKDVDLLVAPDDFDVARAILAEQFGFAATYVDQTPLDESSAKDVSLTSATIGIELELHRRLFDLPLLLPVDFDTMWAGRDHVTIGGAEVAVLGFTHEALFLFGHGAAHAWFRLKWVQDIARLLHIASSEQARAMADAARTYRLEPLVTSSVDLAVALMGAPHPPPLVALPRGPASRGLVRLAIRALNGPATDFEDPPIGWIARRVVAQARLRRDSHYRWAALTHAVVSPRDRAMLPLPDWASPLYILLKPVLYVARKFRA